LERFQTYFKTLEGLSTEQLDRSAEELVRAEKNNVTLVIAHIAEISRQKGELERGYKNTLDYCVRRLHLSEGSVAMRVQVANISRRFPSGSVVFLLPAGIELPGQLHRACHRSRRPRPLRQEFQLSGIHA